MSRISDPLELLTQQHEDLLALLDTLATTAEPARTRALGTLAEALCDHLAAEQALLYPVVGDRIERSVRDALVAEHAEIKRALAELRWFGLDDANAARRCAALRDLLCGHASYQEEHVFEPAAETLAPIDITLLGNRLQAWFVASVARAA